MFETKNIDENDKRYKSRHNGAYRVLVSLEDLLDARLSLLARMVNDDEKIAEMLESGIYHNRTSDTEVYSYLGIDQNEFLDQWGKRDKTLLMNATPTLLLKTELAGIKTTLMKEDSGIIFDKIELVINTFPYHIDMEGQNFIKNAFSDILLGIDDISCIYCAYQNYTMNYLSNYYSRVYIYDYMSWLSMIGRDLYKSINWNFVLRVPMLLSVSHDVIDRALKEEFNEVKDTLLDDERMLLEAAGDESLIFDAIAGIFSSHILLQFIPTSIFSVELPDVKEPMAVATPVETTDTEIKEEHTQEDDVELL